MTECTATVHNPTPWTYKHYRCRCPETVAAMRRAWHRTQVRGQSHRLNRSRDPHIDEIAVERVMRGDWVPLTPAERREVALRLTAQGWPAGRIAQQLRVAQRSVVRYRMSTVCPPAALPDDVDGGEVAA